MRTGKFGMRSTALASALLVAGGTLAAAAPAAAAAANPTGKVQAANACEGKAIVTGSHSWSRPSKTKPIVLTTKIKVDRCAKAIVKKNSTLTVYLPTRLQGMAFSSEVRSFFSVANVRPGKTYKVKSFFHYTEWGIQGLPVSNNYTTPDAAKVGIKTCSEISPSAWGVVTWAHLFDPATSGPGSVGYNGNSHLVQCGQKAKFSLDMKYFSGAN